jgi:site-specific DNA-methyltransferase (adenine-specific)
LHSGEGERGNIEKTSRRHNLPSVYKPSAHTKRRPGEVRDAIFSVLTARPVGASLQAIERYVTDLIGHAARSSVRSYLRLNTPSTFIRTARGHYGLEVTTRVRATKAAESRLDYWRSFAFGKSLVLEADCLNWLREQQPNTAHAVVTDPPLWTVRIFFRAARIVVKW